MSPDPQFPMIGRFIGEPIAVEWDNPPYLEKKPSCPQRLLWNRDTLQIEALLGEWRDYSRRGRMAMNMRPENKRRALKRGSRGVSRFWFRVRVTDGRVFDIYYDRSAASRGQGKGAWFLHQEIR